MTTESPGLMWRKKFLKHLNSPLWEIIRVSPAPLPACTASICNAGSNRSFITIRLARRRGGIRWRAREEGRRAMRGDERQGRRLWVRGEGTAGWMLIP